MTGSRFSIGLLALGLTVLAITLAFVLWPPGLRNESEAALPSASEVSEVSSPPELAQEPASEAAPSVPGMAEGSRAVTPATALRGVLRDSEGRAITGARLAWTVLGDELCPPGTQVDPQARAAIEAASVRTTSGAGGAFQFAEQPGEMPPAGSVVWVSHPGYRLAAAFPLQAGEGWAWPEEFALTPAAGVEVEVVETGASGTVGVPGATVVQLLRSDGTFVTPETDPLERARRVHLQAWVTGEDGSVRVPAAEGEMVLFAELGELRSAAWSGEAGGEVELLLRGTFELTGAVVLEGGGDVPEGARVWPVFQDGASFEYLASVPVRADGRFGPRDCPVLPGQYLGLYLAGGGIVPSYRAQAAPRVGERVDEVLSGVRGEELAVRVLRREDSTPIEGAGVHAFWPPVIEGGTGRLQESTDAAGVARLSGIPAGSVHLNVEAEGQGAVENHGPHPVPTPGGEAVVVYLEPSGRVTGRCLYRGEPVPRFSVDFWVDEPLAVVHREFEDPEGRFELLDVPVGKLHLYAYGGGLPASEIVSVEATAEASTEVLLELPEPIRGVGQVTDAVTGEPIPRAAVQPYSCYLEQLLYPTADASPVDAEGRFELEAFAPGPTGLAVFADGYSSWYGSRPGTRDEVLDFGVIAMQRLCSASLRLVLPPGGRPEEHSGWTEHGNATPAEPFSAGGVLELEGLRPAETHFRVRRPDGATLFLAVALRAGTHAELVFDLTAGAELTVEIAADGGEVPEGSTLHASYRSQEGFWCRQDVTARAGAELRFAGLTGETAVLELRGPGGAVLAGRTVSLPPAGPDRVRLEPGGGAARFRVVDLEGEPLPGTQVRLRSAGQDVPWTIESSTDARGELVVPGVPVPAVLVGLSHPTAGSVYWIEVPVGDAPEEAIEVVLDAPAAVDLLCARAGVPVTGVTVQLYDGLALGERDRGFTDAAGRVRFEPYGLGSYWVRATKTGFWPVVLELEARPAGSPPQELTLRGLGDLRLAARDAGGAPVAGLAVSLFSLALGEEVAGWVADGLVAAPAGGLRTGPDGVLELEGLPEGAYRWELATPAGAVLAGEVDVLASDAVEVVAALP